MEVEMTVDPGWAYCPRCNTLSDWGTGSTPNCPHSGLCKGRSILPIPTTKGRNPPIPGWIKESADGTK